MESFPSKIEALGFIFGNLQNHAQKTKIIY